MTINLKGIREWASLYKKQNDLIQLNPSTVIALLDRLEAAEKDAARYRWLSKGAYVGIAPYPRPHEVWCLRLPKPSDRNNFDETIDAAMKDEQK